MNQYSNFNIPIIQSDQPYGAEAFNRGMMGGFNQLGAMAFQKQQKQQEMADTIQQLQVKAYLEQEMNKRAFQSNIEMMRGAGLFGGMEGQTAGQPSMSLSPAGNQFSKAPFRQNTPALSSLNNSPEADPSMFIRKPSFNIDPMTGKVTMGISEVENPYFRQKMGIEKAKQIEDQKPYSA